MLELLPKLPSELGAQSPEALAPRATAEAESRRYCNAPIGELGGLVGTAPEDHLARYRDVTLRRPVEVQRHGLPADGDTAALQTHVGHGSACFLLGFAHSRGLGALRPASSELGAALLALGPPLGLLNGHVDVVRQRATVLQHATL